MKYKYATFRKQIERQPLQDLSLYLPEQKVASDATPTLESTLSQKSIPIEGYNHQHNPLNGQFGSGGSTTTSSTVLSGISGIPSKEDPRYDTSTMDSKTYEEKVSALDQTGTTWFQSLSVQQSHAVATYTVDSTNINNVYRHDGKNDIEDAQNLSQALGATALGHATTVYRGMVSTHYTSTFFSQNIGGVIEDKGFVSTTLDPGVAEKFIVEKPGEPVIMHIRVPKEFPAAYIGKRTSSIKKFYESELLLENGSAIIVRSVSKDEKGRTLVNADAFMPHAKKARDDASSIPSQEDNRYIWTDSDIIFHPAEKNDEPNKQESDKEEKFNHDHSATNGQFISTTGGDGGVSADVMASMPAHIAKALSDKGAITANPDGSYHGTANGKQYHIVPTGSEQVAFSHVGASRIAKILGAGDHIPEIHAGTMNKEPVVLAEDSKGGVSLTNTAAAKIMATLPAPQLVKATMLEYILGVKQDQSGHYLLNGKTGKLNFTQLSSALIKEDTAIKIHSFLMKTIGEKRMKDSIDHGILGKFLSQENKALLIADRYAANPDAKHGFAARFEILHTLAAMKHPTWEDFFAMTAHPQSTTAGMPPPTHPAKLLNAPVTKVLSVLAPSSAKKPHVAKPHAARKPAATPTAKPNVAKPSAAQPHVVATPPAQTAVAHAPRKKPGNRPHKNEEYIDISLYIPQRKQRGEEDDASKQIDLFSFEEKDSSHHNAELPSDEEEDGVNSGETDVSDTEFPVEGKVDDSPGQKSNPLFEQTEWTLPVENEQQLQDYLAPLSLKTFMQTPLFLANEQHIPFLKTLWLATLDTAQEEKALEPNEEVKEEAKEETPEQPQSRFTQAMIALYLDPDTALKLALSCDGACAPEDLHVTLMILGQVSAMTEEASVALKKALGTYAAQAAPVHGTVSGVGCFTNTPPDNDTMPFYASIDIAVLPQWREALRAALPVPIDMTHGFTPHCTLAYIAKDTSFPTMTIPAEPLLFDTLWLCIGDEKTAFALQGREEKFNSVHRHDNGEFGTGAGSGASKDALASALHEKYPATTFSFDGVDPSLAPGVANHIDMLMTEFPETAQTMQFFGTPKKGVSPEYAATPAGKILAGTEKAYAYTAKDFTGGDLHTSIVLNPDLYGNPKHIAEQLDIGVKSGWSPAGVVTSPETIITHEFGHAVDFTTVVHNDNGRGADLSAWQMEWADAARNVSEYVSSQETDTGTQLEGFAEGFTQMRHAPKDQWSVYTSSLKDELQKLNVKTASSQATNALMQFMQQEGVWIEPGGYGPQDTSSSQEEKFNSVHREDNGEFGFGGGSHGASGSSVHSAEGVTLARDLSEKFSGTTFSFDGVHKDLVKPIGQDLDHLLTQYPETAQTIKYIGTPEKAPAFVTEKDKNYALTGNTETNATTYTTRIGDTVEQAIILNPGLYSNPKRMQHDLDQATKRGWTPNGVKSSPTTVLTHEFGHAVNWTALSNKATTKAVGDFLNKNRNISGSVSGYARSIKDAVPAAMEAFAEGFNQIQNAQQSKWPTYTKNLQNLLTQNHIKGEEPMNDSEDSHDSSTPFDFLSLLSDGKLWQSEPYPGKPQGQKFNPTHREDNGEFGSGGGGGSGGNVPSGGASTSEAVARDLSTHFPKTTFSFEGVHASIVKNVGDDLHGLLTQYPETAKTIKYIGTPEKAPDFVVKQDKNYAMKGDTKTCAATYTTKVGDTIEQAIILNPGLYNNPKLMKEQLDECTQTGWTPAGVQSSETTVLTHEFGHAVNWNALYNAKTFVAVAQFMNDNRANSAQVSGYARSPSDPRTSQLESFAEGFNQMKNAPESQWPDYTKNLQALLTKNNIKAEEHAKEQPEDDFLSLISDGKVWKSQPYGVPPK